MNAEEGLCRRRQHGTDYIDPLAKSALAVPTNANPDNPRATDSDCISDQSMFWPRANSKFSPQVDGQAFVTFGQSQQSTVEALVAVDQLVVASEPNIPLYDFQPGCVVGTGCQRVENHSDRTARDIYFRSAFQGFPPICTTGPNIVNQPHRGKQQREHCNTPLHKFDPRRTEEFANSVHNFTLSQSAAARQ